MDGKLSASMLSLVGLATCTSHDTVAEVKRRLRVEELQDRLALLKVQHKQLGYAGAVPELVSAWSQNSKSRVPELRVYMKNVMNLSKAEYKFGTRPVLILRRLREKPKLGLQTARGTLHSL